MLAALTRREVQEAGEKLARNSGRPFRLAESGVRVSGIYRQPVQLVNGEYASVERPRNFAVVPSRPAIEKVLGREVSGIMRGSGISWVFERKRGPGIGT